MNLKLSGVGAARRGWGHCGLESELLRSELSQRCPPGAWSVELDTFVTEGGATP